MFFLGVPRPGVGGGTHMALGWCLLGVGGSRDPFSGTPVDHGGGGGAAPSQAAWLLLLHCFTVGGVWRERPVDEFFFSPRFSFCQTYLLPLVKVLAGAQGRKSKKRVN